MPDFWTINSILMASIFTSPLESYWARCLGTLQIHIRCGCCSCEPFHALDSLMDFSGFLLPKIPEIEGVKVARRDEAWRVKFLFFNTPDNELVTIDPNKTTKVCKRNFLSTLFFFFCPCFLATFSGGCHFSSFFVIVVVVRSHWGG